MDRAARKRQTDLQILSQWIGEGAYVADLGCGRGVLLDHLAQTRRARIVGVDMDGEKILACVKRGVPAYQGDAEAFLREFPDQHFDWVVLSRTVQELSSPGSVLREAARTARQVAVGFVNYGYWRNRLAIFSRGQRVRNEVYPRPWHETAPINPLSLGQFESSCAALGLAVTHRALLRADWETPVHWAPEWRCGYALFALHRLPPTPPAPAT